MSDALAFRVKQIMTNQHLSLTQAAKQIGISPTSLRKVLKEIPMSRTITFKVNRFIDSYNSNQNQAEAAAAKPEAVEAKPVQAADSDKTAKQPQANKQNQSNHPDNKAKQANKQNQANNADNKSKQTGKQNQSGNADSKNKQAGKQTQGNNGDNKGKQSQNGNADNKNKQTGKQNQNGNAEGKNKQAGKQNHNGTDGKNKQAGKQPQNQSNADNKNQPAGKQDSVAKANDSVKQAAPKVEQLSLTEKQTVKLADPTHQLQPKAQPEKPLTIQIYMDESFARSSDYQRNMAIGATVINPDNVLALTKFGNTLYPFGWQPGDEVKARGKQHDQIATLLKTANSEHARTFAVHSAQSDTGNFTFGLGILYPYLAATLRIWDQLEEKPAKLQLILDQRNEIQGEQMVLAAKMLNRYLKAQTGNNVAISMRTTDSKTTLGVQYSDFISHAAMTFSEDQLNGTGITVLPALGHQPGDELTLFSMVGIQKFLIDDAPIAPVTVTYKHPLLVAADRIFKLSSQAATKPDLPDELMSSAKLVINQLLQVAPSSVSGAINKMPFQTWYDMVARAASILHYTDETLPTFTADPDAMQIADDALNSITTRLATL